MPDLVLEDVEEEEVVFDHMLTISDITSDDRWKQAGPDRRDAIQRRYAQDLDEFARISGWDDWTGQDTIDTVTEGFAPSLFERGKGALGIVEEFGKALAFGSRDTAKAAIPIIGEIFDPQGEGNVRARESLGTLLEVTGDSEPAQTTESLVERGLRSQQETLLDLGAMTPDQALREDRVRELEKGPETFSQTDIGTGLREAAEATAAERGFSERSEEINKLPLTHPLRVLSTIRDSAPITTASIAAAVAAGPTGAVLTSGIFEAGFSAKELRGLGFTDEQIAQKAPIQGFIKGMLEAVLPAKLAGNLLKKSDGLQVIGHAIGIEGITEVLQEAVDIIGGDDGIETIRDLTNVLSDNVGRMAEAGVLGALSGGVIGGVTIMPAVVEKIVNERVSKGAMTSEQAMAVVAEANSRVPEEQKKTAERVSNTLRAVQAEEDFVNEATTEAEPVEGEPVAVEDQPPTAEQVAAVEEPVNISRPSRRRPVAPAEEQVIEADVILDKPQEEVSAKEGSGVITPSESVAPESPTSPPPPVPVVAPVQPSTVEDYKGTPVVPITEPRVHPVHGEETMVERRTDVEGNVTIAINESQVQKAFDNKQWTKPRVEGVTPLAEESFDDVSQWREFTLEHEVQHANFPTLKSTEPGYAANEEQINRAAAKELGVEAKLYPVPLSKAKPSEVALDAQQSLKELGHKPTRRQSKAEKPLTESEKLDDVPIDLRDTLSAHLTEASKEAPSIDEVEKARLEIKKAAKPKRRRRGRSDKGAAVSPAEVGSQLVTLGRDVVSKGATTLKAFTEGMRKHLGDAFDSFSSAISVLYDTVRGRKQPKTPLEGDYAVYNDSAASGLIKGIFQNGKDAIKKIDSGMGIFFTPLASQAGRIDKRLEGPLKKYDFELSRSMTRDETIARAFLDKVAAVRESKDEFLAFKDSLLNGDFDFANKVADTHGFRSEFDAVQEMLSRLREEMIDMGLDIQQVDNYFPRNIIDLDGLEETLPGKIKGKDEHIELAKNISALSNSAVQPRLIDQVKPGQLKFYADPEIALLNYTRQANRTIFSRDFLIDKPSDQQLAPETLIGKKVEDILGKDFNKMDLIDRRTAILIYESVFRNEGITSTPLRVFRNVGLSDALGSVTSAIIQLDDIAFAAAVFGIRNTVEATGTTVANIGRRRKGEDTKGVTKADVYINEIAHELLVKHPARRPGAVNFMERQSAKIFDSVVKWTGMKALDGLGKEVIIQAAYNKLQKESKKNDLSARSKRNLDVLFTESQQKQVVSDLKKDQLSDDVRLLLFHEVTKIQPISLTAVPSKFHTSGNGRIFYTLKTFFIARLNAMRTEVTDKDVPAAEATRMAFRLAAILGIAGFGLSELKDWLLRRKTSIPEQAINSLFSILGFQKFFLYQARREGAPKAAASFFLPPKAVFERSWDDYQDLKSGKLKIRKPKDILNLKAVQSIPTLPATAVVTSTLAQDPFSLGGKFAYWREGGGKKRTDARELGALYSPQFNWLGYDLNPNIYFSIADEGYKTFTGGRLGKTSHDAFKELTGERLLDSYGRKTPSKTFTFDKQKYKMTPAEYQKFLEITGKMTRLELNKQNIEWGKVSSATADKRDKIISNIQGQVRRQMFPEIYGSSGTLGRRPTRRMNQ